VRAHPRRLESEFVFAHVFYEPSFFTTKLTKVTKGSDICGFKLRVLRAFVVDTPVRQTAGGPNLFPLHLAVNFARQAEVGDAGDRHRLFGG
jgi:hypothetical protein